MRYGLSFDPRVLVDLLQAPDEVRDDALSCLQEIVAGQRFGRSLTGDLDGYRKIPLAQRRWRLIYGQRPAPEQSQRRQEIHVLAVRQRADVYDEVGRRLGMTRRPLPARTHAARSRPPQLATRPPLVIAHPSPHPRHPAPLPSEIPTAGTAYRRHH
ncbi:hypothetical protein JGS22_015075 [Streptomyces sp. P38-E01]|uniref:Uncharacterized protein n=1 Tax=Streptomyces tardus TaxID=2780544 RepID=A0A949JF81_9ACTN|nr:hypothetical protein [Streptomyces tardus]MBU7598901.1 hypothetical protein [Streptomyces tardus]